MTRLDRGILATLRSLPFASALLFHIFSSVALAQSVAPADATPPLPATGPENPDDEVVLLSPFVVEATEDKEKYRANSTLAGTRVRTDINDTASAISVVTAQFLQDTGVKNSQALLVYTPNTEVAGLQGNFTGQAGEATYHEALINPSATTRVRGLDAADNTRDYFITDIPWDDFDTGRIDIQRGPNSILFGAGSPAGIINNSINGASFANSYKYENVVGSYGSARNSVDANYVLRPNELAIRISLLSDDESYQQSPAFNDQKRFFAALRWDPKLFKKGNPTSIRMNFEKGGVSSNNPRAIPPTDQITPWFATGDYYGNPGLNKATLNEYVQGDAASDAANRFIDGILGQPGSGANVLSIFNGAGNAGSLPHKARIRRRPLSTVLPRATASTAMAMSWEPSRGLPVSPRSQYLR
jgi:outer membrane receptor protein involved in Fe transport